jgi:hypothetical protein
MLMVIIGAGASYDSSPDKLPPSGGVVEAFNRPPLADDLFADRGVMRETRTIFPQIHQLIPELNPRPGRSIEDSLQRLEVEAKTNPRRPQQLTAVRYYLQELFRVLTPRWIGDTGGVTNYQALLGRIAHFRGSDPEPVLIVTFNYDTLIEESLISECGMHFEVMADYTSGPDYKLFKLHGSENWGRYLNMAPRGVRARENKSPWTYRSEMIEQAAFLSITDKFFATGTRQPFSGGPPLYPAIAIPVREKERFECPVDHVGLMVSLIPKVTKIITIGWRGAERHFLTLLAQGLVGSKFGVDIVTVAGSVDEARATRDQIRGVSIPVSDRGTFASFSNCVADLQFDEILRM